MIVRLRALADRRPELIVLFGFALVTIVLLTIFKLGSEISEGDTRAFDVGLLTGLRHVTEGNRPWQSALRVAMLDATALGDTMTLVLVVAMVVGFLILAQRPRQAWILLLATASGAAVTTALKLLFDRPRPALVAHLTSFGSASFPSGHAMNAAVAYLTMATLLAATTPSRRLRIYVLGCAIVLTLLVGISRVYLGVHWPTDVLAGWMAGAGWAALCWSIAWWSRARQAVVAASEA